MINKNKMGQYEYVCVCVCVYVCVHACMCVCVCMYGAPAMYFLSFPFLPSIILQFEFTVFSPSLPPSPLPLSLCPSLCFPLSLSLAFCLR
uniref:Wsv094 n=1 Tax=Brugia timori TaxID=42155 RepID=A0A0R3R3U5_9BILA